jgi:Fe-S cluster assembly protein SufD
MSIQVSSAPEQTGVSNAAQMRVNFFDHLLTLAKQAPDGSSALREIRDRAPSLLQEQSFPTTRDEEWRFTDLSELVQMRFESVSDHHSAVNIDSVGEFRLPEESTRLVFMNGIYAPEMSSLSSLPPGVLVSNLSGLSEEQRDRLSPYLAKQSGGEELFTALNTVGLTDAAVVLIPKNQALEQPLHLLFVATSRSTPTFMQPRCLVVAEANSSVTLIEDFVAIGEGAYFTNAVTEIFIEDNAQVSHTRVQRDSLAAYHVGKTAVSQARNARYVGNAISLGAKLSRHHLNIYSLGEQTETHLNELTMIAGDQLADTHSAIALTKPYCTTRQLHKCIIDDRAHGVFNGKVFVPKAAQLTDAGQLNRNLLLSPKARVDTKPQLEIVADNVKCTHGATVSQLDTDEVFYLQSRGIDAASAQKLLVYAFAYEILDQIPVASLKQTLSNFVTTHTR